MPLTILSYRLDRALFGPGSLAAARPEHGRGYHVTNVALALALVGLVYSLALALGLGRAAAAAGAALAVLHPAAVESIAWITGRKELLATILVVAALRVWLAFVRRPSRARCAAFVALSLAALASKPTAVMLLPIALWLSPRLERATLRRAALALGLLATAAAVVVVVSLGWQRDAGATGELGAGSLRRALFALGHHVGLLAWPVGLRAKYLLEPGGLALPLLAVAALVAVAVFMVHPRLRRGPAAAGVAFAFTAYLPSSGIVPLERYLADSYLGTPLAGVGLAFASAVAALSRRWHGRGARPALAAATTLLAVLAALSFRQAGVWRSSEKLWLNVVAHHPDNAIACRMLGEGQIEDGNPARAIATYAACVRRFGLAPFANNLALAHFLVGDRERARHYFRWILARRPGDRRALKYLQLLGP
jgi:hypothetical protein